MAANAATQQGMDTGKASQVVPKLGMFRHGVRGALVSGNFEFPKKIMFVRLHAAAHDPAPLSGNFTAHIPKIPTRA